MHTICKLLLILLLITIIIAAIVILYRKRNKKESFVTPGQSLEPDKYVETYFRGIGKTPL